MSVASQESTSTVSITADVDQATIDILPKGCLGVVTQGKRIGTIRSLACALLSLANRVHLLRPANHAILEQAFGSELMDQHTRGLDQKLDQLDLNVSQQAHFIYHVLVTGQRRLLVLFGDAIQNHAATQVQSCLGILRNGMFVQVTSAFPESAAHKAALRLGVRLQLMLALALPGLIERTSEATDDTHEEVLATFIDLYHKYDWTSANGKLLTLHQAHINKLAERQGGGGSQKDDERTPDRRPAAADSTQQKPEPDDAVADLADLMATAASAGNGSDGLTQLVRFLRDEGGGDTAKQVVRLLTEQYNVGTPAARAAATEARIIARANDHNLRPLIALIAVLMRTPHIEPRLKSFVENFVIPECQLHPFLQGRVDTFSFSSRAKSLRNALGRLRKAIRNMETITLSDHGADTIDMLAELVAIFIVNLNVPPLLRLMDWVAVGKRVGELSGSTSLSTLRTMGDQEKSSDANEAIRRHVKICPHTHGYYGKIDIDDLAGLTYTTTAAADRIIEDLDGDDDRQGNGRTAARLTAGSEKETERESNKEKEKIDLNKISKGARDQFFQHELARRLGPYLPGRCIRCSNKHPGGWTQCTADPGPLEKNHAKILKDIPQLGGILAALDVLAAVK